MHRNLFLFKINYFYLKLDFDHLFVKCIFVFLFQSNNLFSLIRNNNDNANFYNYRLKKKRNYKFTLRKKHYEIKINVIIYRFELIIYRI